MKMNILVFAVVWIVIAFCNLAYIDAPPYWDDLIGMHAQSMWLVNHDFDILRLWRSPLTYETSNIYPLGMLPVFFGLMYKFLPPLAVHVVGHLLNMGCLAGCFTICYRVVRRYQPWHIALVAALAAVTEPIAAGQSAALGQECLLALLTLVSLMFFQRKRYYTAYCFAAAAFFIKYTGIILLLAYAAYWSLVIALYYWRRHRLSRLRRQWAVSLLLAAAGIGAMSMWGGMPGGAQDNLSIHGLMRILFFCWYYYPLLILKAAVVLLAVSIFWRRRRQMPPMLPWVIFCFGFLTAFFSHVWPLPRYLLIIIFPLTTLLFTYLPRRIVLIGGLAVILLQVVNMDGGLYPKLTRMSRSGALRERSREYLRDLDASRRMCRWIEDNASLRPVIAKWPFVHMLTVPEFRYVSKPVEVFCPDKVHDCCRGVTVFGDNVPRLPQEIMCLYADNDFEYMFGKIRLRPRGAVSVLYADDAEPSTLFLYLLPRPHAGR